MCMRRPNNSSYLCEKSESRAKKSSLNTFLLQSKHNHSRCSDLIFSWPPSLLRLLIFLSTPCFPLGCAKCLVAKFRKYEPSLGVFGTNQVHIVVSFDDRGRTEDTVWKWEEKRLWRFKKKKRVAMTSYKETSDEGATAAAKVKKKNQ